MIDWTGRPTRRLCARKDRADCTSSGGWRPSTSAKKQLLTFSQTFVASALFCAVVCWGGSIKRRDVSRLDKLVRKLGSVVGTQLESLASVAEQQALSRLLSIMDNPLHPLPSTISRRRSSFSDSILSLSCSTGRLRKSFLPHAMRLFNSTQRK